LLTNVMRLLSGDQPGVFIAAAALGTRLLGLAHRAGVS
jgi:hypothetical protein